MRWERIVNILLAAACSLGLCSCALSTVEDGDYIGMTRTTRSFSFRPLSYEPVRPRRPRVIYRREACAEPSSAPAAGTPESEPPSWAK